MRRGRLERGCGRGGGGFDGWGRGVSWGMDRNGSKGIGLLICYLRYVGFIDGFFFSVFLLEEKI